MCESGDWSGVEALTLSLWESSHPSILALNMARCPVGPSRVVVLLVSSHPLGLRVLLRRFACFRLLLMRELLLLIVSLLEDD